MTISSPVTFTNSTAAWVFRDLPKCSKVIKFGRTVIHDNCFISLGVSIMLGVSIGPNVVLAAESVVTADAPPNTVFGGVRRAS